MFKILTISILLFFTFTSQAFSKKADKNTIIYIFPSNFITENNRTANEDKFDQGRKITRNILKQPETEIYKPDVVEYLGMFVSQYKTNNRIKIKLKMKSKSEISHAYVTWKVKF
jgi:hypothetical protein